MKLELIFDKEKGKCQLYINSKPTVYFGWEAETRAKRWAAAHIEQLQGLGKSVRIMIDEFATAKEEEKT